MQGHADQTDKGSATTSAWQIQKRQPQPLLEQDPQTEESVQSRHAPVLNHQVSDPTLLALYQSNPKQQEHIRKASPPILVGRLNTSRIQDHLRPLFKQKLLQLIGSKVNN